MIALLLVLWPLFALIVLGYVLRRAQFPGEAFWPGAERLNYFVLFPALLFNHLATAPLDSPQLSTVAAGVLLTLTVGWIGLVLARRRYHWPARYFGVITQGILRFNTYLGLATVSTVFGAEGLTLAALVLGLLVPTANLLSVWALTAEKGFHPRTLLAVLRNPLILACLAGTFVNLSGIGLPGGTSRLLGLLAAASLPLGLLGVGAALQIQSLGEGQKTLLWSSGVRLLGMPLLAFTVAHVLGLSALASSLLVLFFALPTAPTAYTLTRQLGGDGALMAQLITVQTLAAALTLPLVLGLLA